MLRNQMRIISSASLLLATSIAAAGPINVTSQMRQVLGDANAHGAIQSTQDIRDITAPDANRFQASLKTLADVGDAVAAVDAWQDSVVGTSALFAAGSFHSEASIEKGAVFGYGVGGSTYVINFQVAESSPYVIRGLLSSSEGVHTRVALSRGADELHNILVNNDSQTIDVGGVLNPGTYQLTFSAFGTAFTNNGSTYDYQDAHFRVQLRTAGPEQDITADGVVDVFDLFMVLEGWGACDDVDGHCLADLTDDHLVDVFDLFALLAAWGS